MSLNKVQRRVFSGPCWEQLFVSRLFDAHGAVRFACHIAHCPVMRVVVLEADLDEIRDSVRRTVAGETHGPGIDGFHESQVMAIGPDLQFDFID